MKEQISNDIILRILQNTYLFRIQQIDWLLTELFSRYINILDYINIKVGQDKEDRGLFLMIEIARSILYFIGYYYTEDFGVGAIERRLTTYDIEPLRFYEIIDGAGTFDLSNLREAEAIKFEQIINFYVMLKRWKNLTIPGHRLYLAEDYYNQTRARLFDK